MVFQALKLCLSVACAACIVYSCMMRLTLSPLPQRSLCGLHQGDPGSGADWSHFASA